MLEITICVDDKKLAEAIETIVMQLMESNRLTYQLHQVSKMTDIPDHTTLIIGNSDLLYPYQKKVMMIAILDNHEHDHELAQNCLVQYVLKEDVATKLTVALNAWLDYFFTNYQFSFNEMEEFMTYDVLYFTVDSFHTLTAHLVDGKKITFDVKGEASTFDFMLPQNFLPIGKEAIINLDYIKEYQDNTVTMNDGSSFGGFDEKRYLKRQQRFIKQNTGILAIGDKYKIEDIKKAERIAPIICLLFGLAIGNVAKNAVPWWLAIGIGLALMAVLYRSILFTIIKSSGNYYEFRQDGIYYYDAISLKQRYAWIQAIKKGTEDKVLKFISYDDVAYIRIIAKVRAASMGIMMAGRKNYMLKILFETTTSTLSFEENADFFSVMLDNQNRDDLATVLNYLSLSNKRFESGHDVLMCFNDPNASFQAYMTKKDDLKD